MITQDLGDSIKDNIAAPVHVSVSNAVTIPLVGGMVGSSSRGPSIDLNLIKPEIGAPGASVSAVVGTGTGTEAFGGTSGATPMVTGSAALLLDAYPHRTVSEIKSLLMNTAETTIYNNLANTPGYLAPITRIGGGEVRVNRALKSPAAAWDRYGKSGDLSFGFVDASKASTTLTKWVRIKNYTNRTIRYAISAKFRYANDRLNGAVKISAPARITLAPRAQRTFKVTLTINGNKLREWTLDSGPGALDARALDTLEYDGYLNFNNAATHTDDKDPLHVAWQVLPRKAANITAASTSLIADGTISGGDFDGLPAAKTVLTNSGVGTATVNEYSLVGTGPPAGRDPRLEPAGHRPQGHRRPNVPGPGRLLRHERLVRVCHRDQQLGARDDRLIPGSLRGLPRYGHRRDPGLRGVQRAAVGAGTTGDVRTLAWVQNGRLALALPSARRVRIAVEHDPGGRHFDSCDLQLALDAREAEPWPSTRARRTATRCHESWSLAAASGVSPANCWTRSTTLLSRDLRTTSSANAARPATKSARTARRQTRQQEAREQ